jgi:hypothetical protein
MAGSASNEVETRIANTIFRGQAMPIPTSLYLALFIGSPGEDGTVNEVSSTISTWYSRQDLAAGGAVGTAFSAPVDGVLSNLNSIDFNPVTGTAIVITHTAVFDAHTGGNMLAYAELASAKTYEVNDIATLPIGTFVITIT